jgi:translation initiation factor 1
MKRPPNSRLVYSTGGDVEPKRREAAAAEPPAPGGIRLRVERRGSDRLVTLVTGLPGTPDEIAALAKSLKSACSTGGTFKDGVLELQGDHCERVERQLAARGLKSKRSGGRPGLDK